MFNPVFFQYFAIFVGLVATIISIFNAVTFKMNSPGKALQAEVAALTSSIDDHKEAINEDLKKHDRRIQKVEDDMGHMPTKDDLAKLTNAWTEVKTEVRLMGRSIDRVDQYLRKTDA